MKQPDFIDEKYVKVVVESAGRTIMMLPSAGCFPAGYRSCLPDHIQEFADLIEAPKVNTPVRLRPTMKQMNELEMVADWQVHLSKHCRQNKIQHIAATVAMAMLHRPTIDGRRVYSWRKLGHVFDISHTQVKNWYNEGLQIITNHINAESPAHSTISNI